MKGLAGKGGVGSHWVNEDASLHETCCNRFRLLLISLRTKSVSVSGHNFMEFVVVEKPIFFSRDLLIAEPQFDRK